MAAEYKWDSPKKASAVLETLLYMTDKRVRYDPFSCEHRQLGGGETEFELRYVYWASRDPCYGPPILKGIISDSANGCVISAKAKYVILSYIGNIFKIITFFMCYAIAIAVLFDDFEKLYIVSIMYLFVSIGFTWRFVYTYKKYGKLKKHLEIMDAAADVHYQTIDII